VTDFAGCRHCSLVFGFSELVGRRLHSVLGALLPFVAWTACSTQTGDNVQRPRGMTMPGSVISAGAPGTGPASASAGSSGAENIAGGPGGPATAFAGASANGAAGNANAAAGASAAGAMSSAGARSAEAQGGRSGASGAAGAGGTEISGGAGSASSDDDCTETENVAATGKSNGGAGKVFVYSPSGNPFVRLRTKMIVPKPPAKSAVLFLWPGLQPGSGGRNFNPIGQGVLQPVLTWGPSCAPNTLGTKYDSWWISAQYVNTLGNYQGYTGCHGGPSMKVGVGDTLDIDMSLSGTKWTQTVVDEANGKSVDFTFDLMGQDQDMALFDIEDTYNSPAEDLIFRSSILTFAMPAPSACVVSSKGPNDYVVKPRPLMNGLECCMPRIVLRARGVAASSPN
jgi:hypothetical protein